MDLIDKNPPVDPPFHAWSSKYKINSENFAPWMRNISNEFYMYKPDFVRWLRETDLGLFHLLDLFLATILQFLTGVKQSQSNG